MIDQRNEVSDVHERTHVTRNETCEDRAAEAVDVDVALAADGSAVAAKKIWIFFGRWKKLDG